jgi:hypothetical protein
MPAPTGYVEAWTLVMGELVGATEVMGFESDIVETTVKGKEKESEKVEV